MGGRLCGTEHFAGEGGEEFLMQSLHSDWLFDFDETKAGDLRCDVFFLPRLSSFSGGSGEMIQGRLYDLYEQVIVNIAEKAFKRSEDGKVDFKEFLTLADTIRRQWERCCSGFFSFLFGCF